MSAAPKQGYVAKRDIKRTPKEKAAEEALKQKALNGICERCQEKINWKFKYDKYKPLKSMGACSGCRGKKVPLNYRTLCGECASARGVCPQCCEKERGAAEGPQEATDQANAGDAPSAVEVATVNF